MALSGSYWLYPCLSLALYGSLWLSVTPTLAPTATLWLTLALSGSLLLSNFAYTVLDQPSGPVLGSQRRCHADALYPGVCLCVLLQAKFLPETTRTLSQLCNRGLLQADE